MKKLMIAAAIVCAAAMSQAATMDWKWTSTLYDHPNGDAAYAGKVYIINANSYDQQTVLSAIIAGGDLADYAMTDGATTSNGKAPSTNVKIADDSSTVKPVRFDEGTGYNFVDYYYAALTTDDDGKDWLFLGSTQNKPVQTADTTTLSSSLSVSKVGFESDTFSAQGWYKAESVPEPTSGLLLLLGVAGLALRRRRA